MMNNDFLLSELLMLQCYVCTQAIQNSRQILSLCKCPLDFFCFDTDPIINRIKNVLQLISLSHSLGSKKPLGAV